MEPHLTNKFFWLEYDINGVLHYGDGVDYFEISEPPTPQSVFNPETKNWE
jgi:hypothetical protein